MIHVHIYFPGRSDDSAYTPATLAVLPRAGEKIVFDENWFMPGTELSPYVRRYTVDYVEHTLHPKRLVPTKVYLL